MDELRRENQNVAGGESQDDWGHGARRPLTGRPVLGHRMLTARVDDEFARHDGKDNGSRLQWSLLRSEIRVGRLRWGGGPRLLVVHPAGAAAVVGIGQLAGQEDVGDANRPDVLGGKHGQVLHKRSTERVDLTQGLLLDGRQLVRCLGRGMPGEHVVDRAHPAGLVLLLRTALCVVRLCFPDGTICQAHMRSRGTPPDRYLGISS